MRLLLSALVLVMAGCGATPVASAPTPQAILATSGPSTPASSEVAASQPAPTTSPVASPSPSFLTTKQAASAYYQLAKVVNSQAKRADKLYGSGTSLRAYKAYWAIIAKADDKFIDGLKKVAWPPEVQADVRALLKADIVYQRRALAASRAKTLSDAVSLSASANRALDIVVDKAAIVLDDLGLAPNS